MNLEILRKFNNKGIFNFSDALSPLTPNNIGMPSGLLASFSPEVVEILTAKRSADLLIGGKVKVLDWAKNEYFVNLVENLGSTTAYSDFGNPNISSINPLYPKTGHYRFSSKIAIGDLQYEQLKAGTRVDLVTQSVRAAMESLAITFNRVAFYGMPDAGIAAGGAVEGLLNNSSLAPYEAMEKNYEDMSFEEVVHFFNSAIAKLIKKTGGNIDYNSEIRVGVTPEFSACLSKPSGIGNTSVLEYLKNIYKNLQIIICVELEKTYNNRDTVYFIAESNAGGVPYTARIGYSELARASRIVNLNNGYTQEFSSGTTGAIIYKPSFISRYVVADKVAS